MHILQKYRFNISLHIDFKANNQFGKGWAKWWHFLTGFKNVNTILTDQFQSDHKWHMWHATTSQVSLSMHLSCEWTLCPNQCKSYLTTVSNANNL